MIRADDILRISPDEEFGRLAMDVFRRQAGGSGGNSCDSGFGGVSNGGGADSVLQACGPYHKYLTNIGITARDVERIASEGRLERIPFLPIEIFKSHKVYCGDGEPEAIFTSSSTGGMVPSKHYVARIADYEMVYTRGFELFYGSPHEWSIYALLPSYLERNGSSLVRMADGLIRRGREAGRGGGFYLYDHSKLLADMAADSGKKILLGVSYALLDLAEEMASRRELLPEGTLVMETGGMKGRREEMSKEAMHAALKQAFGVVEIHSEYGMAELMSQAYSSGGGMFRTPPWMKVLVRDVRDPFDVRTHGRGAINIVDLANLSSCAFIQTQDLGSVSPDGSFTIEGRVARSDIRGCNLLVQ